MSGVWEEAKRRYEAGEVGVPVGDVCLVCRGAWDALEQVPPYYATGGEVCDRHRLEVGSAYQQAAFSGNPPRGVPERQRRAVVSSLLPDVASAPGGLYLWGGVGRGKSWQAVAVLKQRWLHAFRSGSMMSFLWWQEAVLAEAMRDAARQGTVGELQGALLACNVLVVDDLGTARTTEFAKEQLLLAISQRYDMVRPTIFTSNLSLGKLAERMSGDGVDETGDRIASRIAESCRVVHVQGVDRRTQQTGAAT